MKLAHSVQVLYLYTPATSSSLAFLAVSVSGVECQVSARQVTESKQSV